MLAFVYHFCYSPHLQLQCYNPSAINWDTGHIHIWCVEVQLPRRSPHSLILQYPTVISETIPIHNWAIILLKFKIRRWYPTIRQSWSLPERCPVWSLNTIYSFDWIEFQCSANLHAIRTHRKTAVQVSHQKRFSINTFLNAGSFKKQY
jgi:hypothetical protein